MRGVPLALVALLALPLSGCLSSGGGPAAPPLLLASGLFTFEAVERGEPGAAAFDGCAALQDALKQRALDQARVALDQGVVQGTWAWGWGRGAAIDALPMPMAAAEADKDGGASGAARHSAAGAQVTGTNNQEAAADEADLVKTDGEWTYVLQGGVLHVLHSGQVGDVAQHASVDFGPSWGGELLLERRDPGDPADDRLVLVLPGQAPQGEQPFLSDAQRERVASRAMTRVLVLSLADRAAPEVMEDQWIEGQPAGARLVGGHAYVAVQAHEDGLGLRTWVGPEEQDLARLGLSWTDYAGMQPPEQEQVRKLVALEADLRNQRLLAGAGLEDLLPTVLRGQFGLAFPVPADDGGCQSVLGPPQATGRAFTTVLAVDVAGALAQSRTQVVGGASILYADEGALVLASPSQDAWWFWAQPQLEEATDLVWLDLDGLSVEPRAAGRVPGSVLDSFSLDVRGDELRVATTLGTWGRWWVADPVPMTSQVMVLQAESGLLVPSGAVGGIAPGERIWSARFTDERAYLVTFRQTDPLWIVDLRGKVEILGELKVPGVSTYIHPVGEDTLLTIGYGANEDETNLDWGKVELSLFDVSDPARPQRAARLPLAPPGGHSWSGAVDEHRAFTYWPAVGTLAVPMTTDLSYEVRRPGGSEWVSRQHAALLLVDVDAEGRSLALRGEVDQDRITRPGTWGGIQRSYFLGYPATGPVSVYAVSPAGVTAHDLATLEDQGHVAFPQQEGAYGYGSRWVD